MNSKPMSYDSIRTLLPYLEANKRIQLASRVPYLRAMEKVLPLRLESLKYGLDYITINDAEYKVGVVRNYGNTKTRPAPSDGRFFDFDKDGLKRDYLLRMAGSEDFLETFDFENNQEAGILNFEKQYHLLKDYFEKFRILKAHRNFKHEESKKKFWKFLKGCTNAEIQKKLIKIYPKNQPELEKWNSELAKLQDFLQSYPRQDTPDHIKALNKCGGVAHDFDKHGFKILDSLKIGEQRTEILHDDLEMRNLEAEYEEAKRKYSVTEKLNLFDSKGGFKNEDSMMEYWNYSSEHTQQEVDDYLAQLLEIEKRLKCLKTNVEKLHDDLQPFYNRKYNILPDYTPYIQLSVNGKPTELVQYTKKLPCALRYLLFFNRKGPIQINTLSVDQEHSIRVPPGLKFKIRKLNLQGNVSLICDSLKPIVDESSYPLEEVGVIETDDNEFQHETIRTARRLVICSPVVLENLWEIQNKAVQILDHETLLVGDYIEFIESWRNNEKDIGTEWSFYVSDIMAFVFLMGDIPHATKIGKHERSIPLPLTNSAVLHISIHREPYHQHSLLKMVVKNK